MNYILFFTESPKTQSPPIKSESPKATNGIIISNNEWISFKAICKFYSRQSLIVVYISYVLFIFMICCSLIFFENNHGGN